MEKKQFNPYLLLLTIMFSLVRFISCIISKVLPFLPFKSEHKAEAQQTALSILSRISSIGEIDKKMSDLLWSQYRLTPDGLPLSYPSYCLWTVFTRRKVSYSQMSEVLLYLFRSSKFKTRTYLIMDGLKPSTIQKLVVINYKARYFIYARLSFISYSSIGECIAHFKFHHFLTYGRFKRLNYVEL